MPLMRFRTYASGSTLIETMIALFVLAIGLLGVIAMQVNSHKSNQRAQFSSEVQLLAGDFADRIFAFDDVDDDTDNSYYDNLETHTSTATAPSCLTTGCADSEQRQLDVFEWKTEIESRLPAGQGIVDFDAASDLYTITIMWDSERTGATGTNCSGDPSVDLACYSVEVPVR